MSEEKKEEEHILVKIDNKDKYQKWLKNQEHQRLLKSGKNK